MSREEIIERVKKVLSLTGSPNEAEAALAAIKAREILDKYDLDMKDINGKEFEDILEQAETNFGNTEETKIWSFLANGVAKYQNCRFWTSTKINLYRKKIITGTIVGHISDLELFEYTYKYLRHAIELLADKHEFSSWIERRSYYLGAIVNVCERLLKNREEIIKTKDDRALMVISKQDIVDKWVEQNLNLRAGKRSNMNIDVINYSIGRCDADSITLRSGIKTDGNGATNIGICR